MKFQSASLVMMFSKSDMIGSSSLVTLRDAKTISSVIAESGVVRNCENGLYLKLSLAPAGMRSIFCPSYSDVTHPSLTNPKPCQVLSISALCALALSIHAGLASLLFRVLGLSRKVAPAFGA